MLSGLLKRVLVDVLLFLFVGWFVTWIEKDQETLEKEKRLAKKDKLAKVTYLIFKLNDRIGKIYLYKIDQIY